MDFNKMFKNTIYSLLAAFTLMLMPCVGASAQQQTDINKPTRERSKNNDKKSASTKKDDKKNDKKDNKQDEKNSPVKATVKPATKQDNTTKPADKQDDKKDVKPAEATSEKKQEVKEESKPTPPKPVNPNFDGIDVSKYQLTIDWQEIKKNSKIQYVYIKATEGSDLVDERYKQNLHNARKAGFKVGSYHYLTNKSSVVNQFKNRRELLIDSMTATLSSGAAYSYTDLCIAYESYLLTGTIRFEKNGTTRHSIGWH